MDLIIRELSENRAVFYNKKQTVSGEIRATYSPDYNFVELDQCSDALTEEQEHFLERYYFWQYHES
jgi:hypothetical protein